MTLEPYKAQPVVPSERFEADTRGAFETANAADRLTQRLQGLTGAFARYKEPDITDETIQQALKDVEAGKIDSRNVARVAQNVYKKTANDAFVAEVELQARDIAHQIELQQIETGRYDTGAFNKSWQVFEENTLKSVTDVELKNNIKQRLKKFGSQYESGIATMQAKQQRDIQQSNLSAKVEMDTEHLGNAYGENNEEAVHYMQEIDNTLQTMVDSNMIKPGDKLTTQNKIMDRAIKTSIEKGMNQAYEAGKSDEFYAKMTGKGTKIYEGFSDTIYKDTEGNDTIGYGHKLTPAEKKSGKYKNGITEKEAEKLYQQDKAKHTKMLYKEYPGLENQPPQVRAALEDMAFNMGVGTKENKQGLSSFKTMMALLENKQYVEAAQIIRGSKYARQTKGRAEDNAYLIESASLSAEDQLNLTQKAQSYLSKSQRNARSQAKALQKQAHDSLNDAITVMNEGKRPANEDEIKEMYNYADEDNQRKYRVAYGAFNIREQTQHLTLEEQETELLRLREDADTAEEVELYQAVEKQFKERKSMASKDPITLNYNEDERKTMSPIEVGMDAQEMATTLKEREFVSNENIAMFGRQSGHIFTDTEAASLAGWLESSSTPVSEKMQFVSNIMTSVPNKAREAFRQLNKKGALSMSMAGSLAVDGKSEIASRMLMGAVIRKETPGIYLKEGNEKIMSIVDNALILAGEGQTEALYKSVADLASFYASEEGDTVDNGHIKQAIKEITNGIGTINGQSFFLPQGKDEDDVEDFVDDIKIDSIPEFAGLQKENALRMIKEGGLISVGDGKYRIRYNRTILRTADGNPYELVIK